MPDLSDQIEDAANSPARVSTSAGAVDAVPIPDLIAADKYLAERDALDGSNDNGGPRSPWARCLRPARVVPPGAV